MLTHESPELAEELTSQSGLLTALIHTGGGVHVLALDLTIDGRLLGRQVWLTRGTFDVDSWELGLYDFHSDPEDEGIVVQIHPLAPDSPASVASTVVGIIARLGATLQGEPGRIAVDFPTI